MKPMLSLLLALTLALTALPMAQAEEAQSGVLVAYFSRTGNTLTLAREVARQSGGRLFEIVPQTPYPADYNQTLEIARQELSQDARPAVAGRVENMDAYHTVLVGYPIWFGDLPCLVRTFLESYDLAGKRVVPFCTSGSSGLSNSVSTIRRLCPDSTIGQGLHVAGSRVDSCESAVRAWLAGLNLDGPQQPDQPTQPTQPGQPDQPETPLVLARTLTVGRNTRTNAANLLPVGFSGQVTWSSGDETVLRLVCSGRRTFYRGVEPGTTDLTATFADGRQAQIAVTVVPRAQAVDSVSMRKKLTLRPGATRQLSPTLRPRSALDRSLIWYSSNPSVATVENGLVRAVAPGKCTLAALSSSGRRAQIALTVRSARG